MAILHVPAHIHGGSLCDAKVEPTPGVRPFPALLPDADPSSPLCPECVRLWHVYDAAAHRAASRHPNSHWHHVVACRARGDATHGH